MQKFITFIAPYSLVISLLYLFGYWSSFNINVLDHIALADVIKSALYPLIYSSIFLIIGLTIGSLISTPLSKAMPPGGGADLPEAKYIRLLFNFMFLFMLALALYVIFFKVGNIRWYKVAALINIPVIVIIGNAEFASQYINHKQTRVLVVNILCIALLYSYGWGAVNAERAKNNEQTIKINGKPIKERFIGWAGNFLFLWDNSKQVVIAKSKSTIKSMELSVPAESAIFSFNNVEEKPNKPLKQDN
ncbi:hypothetical protein CWC22_011315 [Pseudoalteromonas rubra]|uniref:Uncharacterized protein n=1 Tax=Pseudoalteromonas rubra TaxID=43658 RepID=A0A7S7YWX7_9GAMM|nr:hypothetical protein CWC22_011315 [Pseudoalteromonas rubra]